MRSIFRTVDGDLARDVALVCLADGVVGMSYGALTVGAGFEVWLPVLLSLVVFAGAAQFLFVGVLAAGGSLITATVAGLVVNTRHVPFGLAVGELIGSGWVRRTAGSHLITDESVAFALNQRTPERQRLAYWTCGIGVFVCWNLGVLAGAGAGTVLGDTQAYGLDAAFPAVLLALVAPALRAQETRRAAAAGVVIALAATPFLPAGVPVLLALAGLATAGWKKR